MCAAKWQTYGGHVAMVMYMFHFNRFGNIVLFSLTVTTVDKRHQIEDT